MVNLGFSLVKSNVTTSLLARTVAREYGYAVDGQSPDFVLLYGVHYCCVSNGNNEQYCLRTCTSCHTNSSFVQVQKWGRGREQECLKVAKDARTLRIFEMCSCTRKHVLTVKCKHDLRELVHTLGTSTFFRYIRTKNRKRGPINTHKKV